jgi:hypothetical protein
LQIGVDGIVLRITPMSDTDIVTWLRSILHNDRSVELRCQEAANEIERLREELRECESLLDEYRRVEMDRDRWDSLREDSNE